MINNKRVLIIVPAWNEAESVGDVVREIRGELPEADVLVVDDGSADDTARLAQQAGAPVSRLRATTRCAGRGAGRWPCSRWSFPRWRAASSPTRRPASARATAR